MKSLTRKSQQSNIHIALAIHVFSSLSSTPYSKGMLIVVVLGKAAEQRIVPHKIRFRLFL